MLNKIKAELKGIDPNDLTRAEKQILRATTCKEVHDILKGIDKDDMTHAEKRIWEAVA